MEAREKWHDVQTFGKRGTHNSPWLPTLVRADSAVPPDFQNMKL